jgi:hypothetical protein
VFGELFEPCHCGSRAWFGSHLFCECSGCGFQRHGLSHGSAQAPGGQFPGWQVDAQSCGFDAAAHLGLVASEWHGHDRHPMAECLLGGSESGMCDGNGSMGEDE